MGRFYGKVGFMTTEETAPGVWATQQIVHHAYYGDVTRDHRQLDSSSNVNSSPNINVTIAIVGG